MTAVDSATAASTADQGELPPEETPGNTHRLVLVHLADGIATLTLNRPRKLNALSTALEQALLDALSTPPVAGARAIVFAGTARAFSAGADTTELPEMTPERIAGYYRGSGSLYGVVAKLPQPTIAAVAGYCLGAGFELALACDIRVAETTATFGLPEVGLGILPSSGGLTRLVRAVGPAVAREVILFGDRFGAEEALRLRLVREIVAPGQVLGTAIERARALAAQPAQAIAWTKAAIDAAAESSASASLLMEQLAYAALNRTTGSTP